MNLLDKEGIRLLINAGFPKEDIGISEKSKGGITLYESPDDYFARELIDNACEQGQCDLYDDVVTPSPIIPYDNSRPGLYDKTPYDGNEDPLIGVDSDLWEQVEFIRRLKLGKISIWQSISKSRTLLFRVSNLIIDIPASEQKRMDKLLDADRKILWSKYAKEEWGKCWEMATASLWEYPIEEKKSFISNRGIEMHTILINADNLRKMGYQALPVEAKWITMIYWEK